MSEFEARQREDGDQDEDKSVSEPKLHSSSPLTTTPPLTRYKLRRRVQLSPHVDQGENDQQESAIQTEQSEWARTADYDNSEPPISTRMQQPPVYILPNLMKVKMECDFNPVVQIKYEPEPDQLCHDENKTQKEEDAENFDGSSSSKRRRLENMSEFAAGETEDENVKKMPILPQSQVDEGYLKSLLEMQIVTMESNLNSMQLLAEKIPSDKKIPIALQKIRKAIEEYKGTAGSSGNYEGQSSEPSTSTSASWKKVPSEAEPQSKIYQIENLHEDGAGPIQIEDSIWKVKFQKIHILDKGKEAVKILELLSFLHGDKIPLPFLGDLVPEINDKEFFTALELLEEYSMIKIIDSDFSMSIHRQLQLVILQYLKETNELSRVLTNLVDKCQVILKNTKLSEWSDIFLSFHQIVKNLFDLIPIPMNKKLLAFVHDFGVVLFKAGRYSESLELRKKLEGQNRLLMGENHGTTLEIQHQIAMNLFELERYDEALTLLKENRKKKEIHPDFGVDHPSTINTKHNMASLLRKQKKYDESLELFQQILDQRIKILGENHAWTLATQNMVALVHSDLEHFLKALTLYADLEKKQIEILGPDHKNVLATKHNKAGVLYKMGQNEQALRIFNEVYEKKQEILGENHLDTINTLKCITEITETLEKEAKFKKKARTKIIKPDSGGGILYVSGQMFGREDRMKPADL